MSKALARLVRGGSWLWLGRCCSVQVFMSKKTSSQLIQEGFTVQNTVLRAYGMASGSGTHSKKNCWMCGAISWLSARSTSIFTVKSAKTPVLSSSTSPSRAADTAGAPYAQDSVKTQLLFLNQVSKNLYAL